MTAARSITTHGPDQTRNLGRRLGRLLWAGSLVALHGDLGAGKTCLVQGAAQGLGVAPGTAVTSPTYTIANEYPGRITLVHVDLYRIHDTDELDDLGLWDRMRAPDAACLVEWAQRVPRKDWGNHIRVEFDCPAENSRTLTFTAYGQRETDLLHALNL